jgi:hypothetical protein
LRPLSLRFTERVQKAEDSLASLGEAHRQLAVYSGRLAEQVRVLQSRVDSDGALVGLLQDVARKILGFGQ